MKTKMFGVAVAWVVACCVAVPTAAVVEGCGPLGKTIARTAIDIALAACIAENADMDEGALREVCKWGDDLAPIVKDLIAAQKKGLKKAAKMGACAGAGDAGR